MPPEQAGPIAREIDAKVDEAASLLGAPRDAALVADAIEAVPADGWNDDVLSQLRALALELGALLRRLAALAND